MMTKDNEPPRSAPDALETMRAKLRGVVAHATGGGILDPDLGLSEICVEITRHRNRVFAAGRDEAPMRAELDRCIEALRQIQSEGDIRANSIATATLGRLQDFGFCRDSAPKDKPDAA